MPPYEIDDNFYYSWANLDEDGNVIHGRVKWNMNKDDFSMKVETEPKKKDVPNKFDESVKYLRELRSSKGYLLVRDIFTFFDDIGGLELYSCDDYVNPFELYCGNLDKYLKDMKELRESYLEEVIECVIDGTYYLEAKEKAQMVRDINNALKKLNNCEECND